MNSGPLRGYLLLEADLGIGAVQLKLPGKRVLEVGLGVKDGALLGEASQDGLYFVRGHENGFVCDA